MTQSENISVLHSSISPCYSNINAEIQKSGSVSSCLHRIATRLKYLNTVLQLLDQDLVIYRKTVKTGIYKNNLEDLFKEKVYELKQIQKELKVYHLYNRFTLTVLCQDYCLYHNHIDNDDVEQESVKSDELRSRTTYI